jgi:uracil-DNA glycosylase
MDASLMILLQDWASDDVLSGPFLLERAQLGYDSNRNTNKRLIELLREHFGLQFKDVYATNVFPFVKQGPMKTAIPKGVLVRAAREFALPQIEIVQPRLAVCLGKAAFNAIAVASDHVPTQRLDDAKATPFRIGETEVWCQAHPGRNSVSRVRDDWARMASAYAAAMDPTTGL